MRGVAQELGVQAPSLYWHMRSKEDLLDLLADALLADLDLSGAIRPEGDWLDHLAEIAIAVRRHLLTKRDWARVLAGRFVAGPHFLRHLDTMLDVALKGGLSERDAAYAVFTLLIYVQGFVLNETMPLSAAVQQGVQPRDFLDHLQEALAALPPDQYPRVVALAGVLTGPSLDARFEFGLQRILTGIAALGPPA
jgi:TetR/AcrR family transcriptional regulator, tetracycline repressor protein